MHATSLGKVLLSEMEPEMVEAIFRSPDKSLKSFTPNTITTFDNLHIELRKVREQGFAIDNEEYNNGLFCIAMPVKNYEKQIVAAVSISGPSFRLNFSKIMEIRDELALASKKMSDCLGCKNG